MPLTYEFLVKKRTKLFKAIGVNPNEYEKCLELADKYNLSNSLVETFIIKLLDKACKNLQKSNHKFKKLSALQTFIAALRKEINQHPENKETVKKALQEAKNLYNLYNPKNTQKH